MNPIYILLLITLAMVSTTTSIALLIYNTYSRDITNKEVQRLLNIEIHSPNNIGNQEEVVKLLHDVLNNQTH